MNAFSIVIITQLVRFLGQGLTYLTKSCEKSHSKFSFNESLILLLLLELEFVAK
jgi:hypothetical protein